MDPAEIESKPIKIESMRKKWDQVFHFALKENELQQKENEVFAQMKSRKAYSQWNNGTESKLPNSEISDLPIEKRPTCDRIEIVPQNDKDEAIRVRSRTLEWNQRISGTIDPDSQSLDQSPSNDNSLSSPSSNEAQAPPRKADHVLQDMKVDRSKERERLKFQQLEERRKLRSQKGSLSDTVTTSSTSQNSFELFAEEPKQVTIREMDGPGVTVTVSERSDDDNFSVTQRKLIFEKSPSSNQPEVIEIKKADFGLDSKPPSVVGKTKKKAPAPPPPSSSITNGHSNHVHQGLT